MSHNWIMLKGEIRQDGPFSMDAFAGKPLVPLKGPHDIDKHVRICITPDQLEHVACKSSQFMVVGPGFWTQQMLLIARVSGGDDSPVLACELFAGGCSGWTQAMRRLSRLGYPFAHRLALDVERDCCETFCKAHGIEHIIGPESFVWDHDSLPRSLVVNGDISRKLASASWSLLALASIGGAAQGHHVIFHAKGPPCPLPHIYHCYISYINISLLHPRWDEQCRDTMMTVPPQTSSLPSFSYPASFRHPPPASSLNMLGPICSPITCLT